MTIVKKVVYDEIRRVFPKQVIGYNNLPKSISAVIEIQFQYIKGRKVRDVQILVKEIPESNEGVRYMGKGVLGDFFKVSLPFYSVYELNNKKVFIELNKTKPERRDINKAKVAYAKRDSLSDLTKNIVSFLQINLKEVERLMGDTDNNLGGGIVEYEVRDLQSYVEKTRGEVGYRHPFVRGKVDQVDFEIEDTSEGVLDVRGKLLLGGYDARYDFIKGNEQESSTVPNKYRGLVSKLNKKYGMIFSTKEGLENYGTD